MPYEVVPIIDIPGYGDQAAVTVSDELKIKVGGETGIGPFFSLSVLRDAETLLGVRWYTRVDIRRVASRSDISLLSCCFAS